MKLVSTNVTLVIGKTTKVVVIRKEHAEELRDLLNDFLRMDVSCKYCHDENIALKDFDGSYLWDCVSCGARYLH